MADSAKAAQKELKRQQFIAQQQAALQQQQKTSLVPPLSPPGGSSWDPNLQTGLLKGPAPMDFPRALRDVKGKAAFSQLLIDMTEGLDIGTAYMIAERLLNKRDYPSLAMATAALGTPRGVMIQNLVAFSDRVPEFKLNSSAPRAGKGGSTLFDDVKRSGWAAVGAITIDQSRSRFCRNFKEKRGSPLGSEQLKGSVEWIKISGEMAVKFKQDYSSLSRDHPLNFEGFDQWIDSTIQEAKSSKQGVIASQLVGEEYDSGDEAGR